MVIGRHGDIGSILHDREGAIFFASGASNSSGFKEMDGMRERVLLSLQPWDKCIFYFSTISIYYKDSPYIRHKLEMENIIKGFWENYNIIRIGNIDWGKNPNTFINALRAKKAKGEPYEVYDEWKYMISKEELLLLTDNLPLTGKNEINVFGRMAKPIDLI